MLQGTVGRAVAVAALVMLASPVLARGIWLDEVEDRIDLAESALDESLDRGRLDLAEDRIDAVEDKADDKGIEKFDAIDRHERRSWRRTLRNE